MIKLIAIDLDGTLLNSRGEVSQKNREAIKKAIENGISKVNININFITNIFFAICYLIIIKQLIISG